MSTTNIANVFIIPNLFEQINIAAAKEEWRADNDRYTITSQNARIDQLGIDPSFKLVDGDSIIQLWFCGLGSDNWCDHGLPKQFRSGDTNSSYTVPSLWPARCFAGVCEGDTIHFTINGHDVDVIADQLNFRYRGYGSFKETFDHLARNDRRIEKA